MGGMGTVIFCYFFIYVCVDHLFMNYDMNISGNELYSVLLVGLSN